MYYHSFAQCTLLVTLGLMISTLRELPGQNVVGTISFGQNSDVYYVFICYMIKLSSIYFQKFVVKKMR